MAGLEPEFSRLAKTHSQDAAWQSLSARIVLVDEVAELLIQRFESARDATLNSVIGDLVKMPKASAAVKPQETVSAWAVLDQYQEQFQEPLPRPDLSPAEQKTVVAYYDELVRCAGRYIGERGRVFVGINQAATSDIVELCLVMRLLHVPDDQWDASDTEETPAWLRDQKNAYVLENFCLTAKRPQTAYRFACAGARTSGKNPPDSYGAYLQAVIDERIKFKDYATAFYCIRAALAAGERQNSHTTLTPLRFRLAEVLGASGHARLAAEEMKQVVENEKDDAQAAKAAMLRLKYLYEADQFEQIVAEAPAHAKSERFQGYRPQILYIQWVALRRQNQPDDADKVEAAFLKTYPEHSLAADMYFASAMTALAASDYPVASRLLEIVRYRYAESRLAKKAQEIQERIDKAASKDPPAASSGLTTHSNSASVSRP